MGKVFLGDDEPEVHWSVEKSFDRNNSHPDAPRLGRTGALHQGMPGSRNINPNDGQAD